jgi:drug/metabolite transporter (DMT)-like permease
MGAGRRKAGGLFGAALTLASALCFGSMAIFARVAYASGIDTETLLLLRFAIAAAVLWAILLVRRVPLPRGKGLLVLVGMGAVGYAGQAFSYFSALEHASAGLVALLLYLYPALVAILSRVVLRHPLSRVQLGAIAMALTGSVLTVGGATDGTPLGIFFGVAAASIYAAYILTGSTIPREVSPIASSAIVVSSAGAVFAAIATARGVTLPATAAGWGAVLAIALIGTVAAIALFLAGLERLGPVKASIYSTVEPAFTIVLAAIFLGERLTIVRAAGGALILGAVLILARADLVRGASEQPGGSSPPLDRDAEARLPVTGT